MRLQRGFLMADTATLAVKGLAVTGAAGAAGVAALEVVTHVPERMLLGVPLSVLLVAIVGALIGVLILPERDTERVSASPDARLWRRIVMVLARSGALGGAVLGYAFLAAWTIAAFSTVTGANADAAALPFAGIAGVFIRRLLPKYLAGVEKFTERVFGSRT